MHGKFTTYEQIMINTKVAQKQHGNRRAQQLSHGCPRALVYNRLISEVHQQSGSDVNTTTSVSTNRLTLSETRSDLSQRSAGVLFNRSDESTPSSFHQNFLSRRFYTVL